MERAEQMRTRLERYENFVAQDPDNPNLLAEVADLRVQLGDLAGAESALTRALALSPNDPGLRSRGVVLALARSRFEDAALLAEALLTDGTDSPAIRYNLAFALMHLRRFAEARIHLETIAELPDAPRDTLVLLARALHHLGELPPAVHALQRHLERCPDDPNALGALALAALDCEELDAARARADEALKLEDGNLDALVTLGSLALEAQEGEKAARIFEQATARHPRSGRAWAGRGLAEMLALRVERAVADLERAVQYMPNHIGTWNALAWGRIVLGNLDGAAAAFGKAMELDRNFGETFGGLAVVAVLEGRLADAERHLAVALRLDPGSFGARFAKSFAFARRGETRSAREALDEILRSPIPEGKDLLAVRLARVMRTGAAGGPQP